MKEVTVGFITIKETGSAYEITSYTCPDELLRLKRKELEDLKEAIEKILK